MSPTTLPTTPSAKLRIGRDATSTFSESIRFVASARSTAPNTKRSDDSVSVVPTAAKVSDLAAGRVVRRRGGSSTLVLAALSSSASSSSETETLMPPLSFAARCAADVGVRPGVERPADAGHLAFDRRAVIDLERPAEDDRVAVHLAPFVDVGRAAEDGEISLRRCRGRPTEPPSTVTSPTDSPFSIVR